MKYDKDTGEGKKRGVSMESSKADRDKNSIQNGLKKSKNKKIIHLHRITYYTLRVLLFFIAREHSIRHMRR